MAHHEQPGQSEQPTDQQHEQKKDRAMLITGCIIGLNLLLLFWGLFGSVITYVPGSEGPGPAFHYTLSGAMLIASLMVCNVMLGVFSMILGTGEDSLLSRTVRDFFISLSRAFFLSVAVVLLIGFPACHIGEDLARKL